MSFNTVGGAQVPLELFGGLCTEQPAMNLPPGVSPDCQDMAFTPESTLSRPGLVKVLQTALGSVTVTYAQSFVANDRTIYNFYLDSAGNLWVQNVTVSPTIVTNLGTVTPGSYAKGVTAFGRQFIAFSDGIQGTDVALSWDPKFGLERVTQDGPGSPPTIAMTTIAPSVPTNFTRDALGVSVTATTSTPHGLKVGYLAQVSGIDPEPLGFVATLVINNENTPGVATVTITSLTTTGVGIVPGMFVSITGVAEVAVGGTISSIQRIGGVVTVVTTSAHNLSAGSIITFRSTGSTQFDNLTLVVANVTGASSFSALQPGAADVLTAVTAGTVNLSWPLLGGVDGSSFEIVSVIEATASKLVFQIPISYCDGTWTTGGVFATWNGLFFVKSVPSPTTFTYLQPGPAGDGISLFTLAPMVTPQGQCSPGKHQCQVLFLTDAGYIPEPSPPVQFESPGNAYVSVTNIPIGPPNVVARILAFTGADGAYYFYIPVPAQVNGQVVSTATQVNDNTSTSALFDFSDNTLFASIGISTQGNNLAQQIVLDSALGFAFYGDRLMTYGQRNAIQNLLNMGFDGGSIGAQITGWTGTGALVPGHFSVAVSAPALTQSFFQDAYGAPIATPNVLYLARAWMSGGGCTVTISSASTGFSSVATLTPGSGGWGQATFSNPMPATIPNDMILRLSGANIVDDLSIIFASQPFLDKTVYGSYVNNPQAFDGLSGAAGVEDVRKIMALGIIRATLFALTQDPAGRLHSIQNNGVTEPAGWSTNEIAGDCGVVSPFALTVSQADDATAGGGEEWMAWASASGARIFGGNQPWKISQEIQSVSPNAIIQPPNWNAINTAAWLTIWALNDPAQRRIYFGLPIGNIKGTMTPATAPNIIMHVDYKNLDTAEQIAESPPIHVTFTGKLAARDHARKWCPWNIPANGGAAIYTVLGGPLQPVFFAGNGGFPGTIAGGFGNVFSLSFSKLIDDGLGAIAPYYTTYAFTSSETEQALQLGGQRHLTQYITWNATGVGLLTVTPLVDDLSNPWPITATVTLRRPVLYDDEWGGGSTSGQRVFLKFSVAPLP